MSELKRPRDSAAEQAGNATLNPERLGHIRDLVTGPFQGELPAALFSHSGGHGQTEHTSIYRSMSYSSLSEHGLPAPGRTRVIATAGIAQALPELPIVTNSFNRFDPEFPTYASINREELIRRGVDKDQILEETKSFSTITQLTEMIKMSVDNGWTKVLAMTNEYHLPRMSEMYKRLDEIIDSEQFQETLRRFLDAGGQVEFICAEPVMRLLSPMYADYLEMVKQTPQHQRAVEAEARGLEDLKDGNYRVVLEPERARG